MDPLTEAGRRYRGQLELTWTNKAKCLLAPDDGSYEWIDRDDHRVAEVRLLHDRLRFGATTAGRARDGDNLLIIGDALHGLTSLAALPEYSSRYAGRVQLAYLDPPFNTRKAFARYDDSLEHSMWLTMIRDRLKQIRHLLAPSGSVWVHLSHDEAHYCKVLMDEVFSRDSFVAEIVWQKRTSRENRAAIGSSHDTILIYAPAGPIVWKQFRNRLPDEGTYANPDRDPRGPWRSVPMSAQGTRKNQMYTIVAPDGRSIDPPKGRCWSMVESEYEKLVAQNKIYFPAKGKDRRPRVKAFPEDASGLVPTTWWTADECDTTEAAKKEVLKLFPHVEPFDTPKPERLMRRIIHIATKPGDIVLDCFAGSGTTAAVAHKMKRRWIAIERSESNAESYIVPRLRKVVDGSDDGGISADVGWSGGGSLRVLAIAPSMFKVKEGTIVLADWVIESNLAEAVAAQCGFRYDPRPPFAGKKGNARLAVVNGVVNQGVCRVLLEASDESDTILVYGTAVDPISTLMLSSIRPGSRAKRIPQELLKEYHKIADLCDASAERGRGRPRL